MTEQDAERLTESFMGTIKPIRALGSTYCLTLSDLAQIQLKLEKGEAVTQDEVNKLWHDAVKSRRALLRVEQVVMSTE